MKTIQLPVNEVTLSSQVQARNNILSSWAAALCSASKSFWIMPNCFMLIACMFVYSALVLFLKLTIL